MTFFLLMTLFLQDRAHLEDALAAHVTFLADDLLEGRDTAKRGQKIAALYIAAHFKANGVVPIFPAEANPYFQPFSLYRSVIDEDNSFLSLPDGTRLEMNRDFAFYDLNPLKGEWAIEPYFVGFGLKTQKYHYDDYPEESLKGRYLVMLSGYPPHLAENFTDSDKRREYLREKKVKWAQQVNAAGIIFLANEDFNLPDRTPAPRAVRSMRRSLSMEPVEPFGTDFPVIDLVPGRAARLFPSHIDALRRSCATIVKEARPQSFDLAGAGIKLQVSFDDQAKVTENVIGIVPGTDPELKQEYLVVTAHYDHVGVSEKGVFNGADDNASGTSVILELASRLAAHPARRSIVIMAMTGEEKGLLGSQYFLDHCPLPLDKIVANINMDMVGRNDLDEVALIPAKNKDRSTMNLWVKEINEKLEQPFRFDESLDRYHHRSDHYNFARRGIPALFFFSGDHEDYHQVTDDIDKINFAKMAHIYELVESLVLRVGNEDERPVFLEKHEKEPGEEAVQHQAAKEDPDGG